MSQGLNTLGTLAIRSGEELAGLHAKTVDIHGHGLAWETSLGRVRDNVGSMLQLVHAELAALNQQSTDQRAALAEELQNLNDQIDNCREFAHARFAEVGEAAASVATKLTELNTKFQRGSDNLQSHAEQLRQAVLELEQSLRERHQQVMLSIQAIEQTGDVFVQEMESNRSIVTTQLTQFVEAVSGAQGQVTTQLETAEEEISSTREALAEKLAEIEELVQSQTQDMSEEAKTFLDEKLQDLVKDASEELMNLIKGLEETIQTAGAESSESRELLEPVIDEVKSYLDPIIDGLQSAQAAASRFGVIWG